MAIRAVFDVLGSDDDDSVLVPEFEGDLTPGAAVVLNGEDFTVASVVLSSWEGAAGMQMAHVKVTKR